MTTRNATENPAALIHFVLLVVSHSGGSTPRQAFEFMEQILPELGRRERQHVTSNRLLAANPHHGREGVMSLWKKG